VTGGAGYIGSHVLRQLQRGGHSAVVVDDLRAGHAAFPRGAALVRASLLDRTALAKAFREYGPIAGVVHLAGSISVAESVAQPLAYFENNVVASANLIGEALAHGVRALVFSSSAAVYGHPERQPISEDAPLAPINPYGANKLAVERLLAEVERAHGLRFTALRYFNAAGADEAADIGECHDPETHLIPLALEAAAGLRGALSLYGNDYPTRDGTCIRDYVHVTDLADAHVRALEALLGGGPGGAYNLGSGRGSTIREVLGAIERALQRTVPCVSAPRRAGDPPELVADISRFQRELGWRPRRSDLDTIVRSAWAWLRAWRKLPA
jgi:UDP-glucose-4-epimerase GalE